MNIAHGKPRIVVGVDESPASLAALRWAAREAGLRATRLQVVQAWERARWRVAPYASRLRLRSHEANQRVPDGLLHRVARRTIERHAVDDRADHDASAHKLPDRVGHVVRRKMRVVALRHPGIGMAELPGDHPATLSRQSSP